MTQKARHRLFFLNTVTPSTIVMITANSRCVACRAYRPVLTVSSQCPVVAATILIIEALGSNIRPSERIRLYSDRFCLVVPQILSH